MTETETRDAALRILDNPEQNRVLSTRSGDRIDKLVRDLPAFAQRAVVTQDPDYASAFRNVIQNSRYTPNDTEQAALLRAWDWKQRAQSETTTSGGYTIPVFIDPTVVFSDYESPNDFMRICNVVDITTKSWHGILSSGAAGGFGSESTEYADTSLTSLSQPTIDTHIWQGVIPFSIEVGQDWPDFAGEFTKVLAVELDESLVSKFSNGNGSTEPNGIITALVAAAATVLVTSTVDGSFSETDLNAVWSAVPTKYRRKATWMANSTVVDQVRAMTTNSNLFSRASVPYDPYSVEMLFNKPFLENDYFPVSSTTTGSVNRLVVGDWNSYTIVRRVGMDVEVVPLLHATGNNRPSGQRALIGRARFGADATNVNGFRLLANT